MNELVGAERAPEAAVVRRQPVAVHDLLLQPVDMVVHGELAERDCGGKHKRARQQDEIDQWCERHVDTGMHEAAGMAVGALVQELIWRLKIEIRYHVLEQEHGDRGEDDDGDVGHGRYFDIASAVPSQLGGGGLSRKKVMRSR